MNRRKSWPAGLAVAAAVVAVLPPSARAELRVTPSLGVSETWTDNYFLVGRDQPKDDELITRANAELVVQQQSERVRTRFKYSIDSPLNGPEEGTIFQDGRLDLGTEILRDWFFVDAAGAYGQYSVDPRLRRNPDTVFPGRDSLTDVGTGTITPALRHDFGRVHFDAAYTAGTVRYAREPDGAQGLEDSRYRNANIGLSSLGTDSRLFWSASYNEQRVTYDGGLRVARDQAWLDLALAVAQPFRILARGGLETDPRRIDNEGGLEESTWQAGFAWQFRRGELRLMAGEGVYGDTYDGSLTMTGRIVKADISYHDQTTTQTEQFLPQVATDAAGNLITVGGNDVLSGLDDPFSRLNPDLFRQEMLRGRIGLTGRRTSIELAARSERRTYLLSGVSDTVHGANVSISRTLGPRSRAELSGRYDSVELQGSGKFHDSGYSFTLYRQIGQRLQLIASASRANVTSTSDPYTANWVAVGLQMTFGRAGGGAPLTPRQPGVSSESH